MLHFSKWKVITVLLITALGVVFALPNLFSSTRIASLPNWLPHKQVHLGLDLQGGSHLLLEMQTKEIIDEWLESIRGDIRKNLRDDKIGYSGLRLQKDKVSVRIRKAEDIEKAYKKLRTLIVQLQGSVFTGVGSANMVVEKGEGGSISLTPTEPAITARINAAISSSIETIRRRIDELGTKEPTIQRQGKARILVQVPGLKDPQRLKELIGKTAKLTFQLVDPSVSPEQSQTGPVPPGSKRYPADENDGGPPFYVLKKRIIVSGDDLVDSQPGFDQRSNEPIVSFRFNSAGGKKFGRVTQRNVGRPFAIVLDGKVISAPVIREAILGGSGQISGSFSVKGANDLAILLRSGALPATLTIIEERSVGPSLGADSVAAGKIASVLGLGLVVGFILLAYGTFGVFSVIALLANLAMLVGVLSILQATLTLPGIAGIVLTIGMAVDANVLIFERIREEIRAGKSTIASIDAGYSRALGTILDANITTFIAAFILFMLGSGPVRGFAVTLSIGILTSVFSAFTLTRLMISFWLKSKKRAEVPI